MLLCLGLVGGALFIYFSYTGPAYDGLQHLKSEEAGKHQFMKDQEGTVKKVQDLSNAYKQQSDFQRRASLALPLTPDIAEALMQFNGLSQNNQIGITGFSVDSMGVYKDPNEAKRKKKSGPEALVKPLGKIVFKLDFTSSYDAFKELMRGLETNMRIFHVESIGMKQAGKPNENAYKFTLSIAAFYQLPS